MKKLLVLLMGILCSFSIFAETLALTKAGNFFSHQKVDLEKALDYVAKKDNKAFSELLVSLQKAQTGGLMKAGAEVIILEKTKGMVHFQVKGIKDADFWTIEEALEIKK